jgi:hypothetical protein
MESPASRACAEAGEVSYVNCQEFWNTMPELADQARAEHFDHWKACPPCTARLSRQRALKAGLEAVAADLSSLAAPARVEARLRAAFRSESGLAVNVSANQRWAPMVTWASAVAAMFALAFFLVRDRQPDPPRRSASSVELASVAAGTESDDYAGGLAPDPDSGFSPLPNAARIGPNEDLNMVRVEVPRSSMIALGFTVSPDRAAEPVQADVMLGTDGLARAVRFLD